MSRRLVMNKLVVHICDGFLIGKINNSAKPVAVWVPAFPMTLAAPPPTNTPTPALEPSSPVEVPVSSRKAFSL